MSCLWISGISTIFVPAVTSFVSNIWGPKQNMLHCVAAGSGPAPGGHGHLTLDSLESLNLLLSWPFISISSWDKPEDTADLMRDYQTNAADWFRFAFSSARAWARNFLHLCFSAWSICVLKVSVAIRQWAERIQQRSISMAFLLNPQYSCRFAQDIVRLGAPMFCH